MLLNVRKHLIENKLVTSETMFRKHAASPLLKECKPISDDQVLMSFHKREIDFNFPLQIGVWVLDCSKKIFYDIFYQKLKRVYNENLQLLYCDTDSYLLEIKNHRLFEKFDHPIMKELLDTSNFPPNHHLFSLQNKGRLGCLKSEIEDRVLKETICLSPKCYSTQLFDGTVKATAKGVARDIKKNNLTHALYKKMYNHEIYQHKVKNGNIVSRNTRLYTQCSTKNALSICDKKRYWINNIDSIAYGHPNIPKVHTCEFRKVERNVVANSNQNLETVHDLNYRQKLVCLELFTEGSEDLNDDDSNHVDAVDI